MRSDWNRPETYSLPGEGEIRIVLRVAYDGSAFHGWQAQGNAPSVQGTISELLTQMLGKKTIVYGSGRTDAGVHALSQACHFDTSSPIEAEKYRIILNTKLPKSIRVLSSALAPEGFHARFSTMSREYWYLVKASPDMLPWDDGRIMMMKELPSISLLKSYAKCIFGTHDFTTFASARDISLSKVRDIYVSEWDIMKDTFGYPVLRYRTAGNAFLYHQVRSMVGTMLYAAQAEEDAAMFRERLDSKDRSMALRTAPSDGLYLADVSYDPEKYQWFEEEYGR
ncbi:MAG: tRNA pseudouridine(38-40) synthase TruA [Spirochaetes bacterium]|uniref:tRNA pseudouridine synthase A n=1 Tax=Candidatus Ornithospirochaeta stercoripullorum TaxID=2840899 RepID=A0A9D9E0L8_9SPIO|nr:tRNA pseudouridine(38-40) synthase TruA [Candidatus Ornithospirochaeta stercoripullorum]